MCIINPRRMHDGYGSLCVCVRVCVSDTALAAAYIVYMLKLGFLWHFQDNLCSFRREHFVRQVSNLASRVYQPVSVQLPVNKTVWQQFESSFTV